jgi:DNA polymerase I-like protein with 3'-5' exonuclease and polymerase domains
VIFPRSIGFDVETTGDKPEYALQPFRATYAQARIKAASMAVNDRTSGKLWPSVEDLRTMLNLAVKLDAYVVGWNVAFDASWLIAVGLEEEVFQVKWLDAMLLWRHAAVEPEGDDIPRAKRKSYSLESAMHEFYPDNAGFKEFKDFEAVDAESLDLLLHRNKMDALWTLRLAEKFWGMLEDRQQIAALIEARCIPAMAKTKVLGLVSSKEAAQELAGTLEAEAISIYRELLATSPEAQGVNLGSPKQLQKLLYKDWKLPVDRFSKKTGDPSTDKYALFFLAALDPRAHLLKKLREAKNNRKKYAIGTINSLEYNGDGRVRPQAKIFSTYTSRITYGSSDKAEIVVEKVTKKNGLTRTTKKGEVPVGVALHQWKRGKEYRRLIKPPPGYLLTEFDFAGQEFRWMAVASLDETMLSLCAPGEDAHSYMGAQIAQRSYKELIRLSHDGDKEAANDRKCGKFCNLSYQYRVSARTATLKAIVDYEMVVDETFIKQTQAIYKKSYPGVGGQPHQRVGGYWASQIAKCKQLGYAETFAGRRVQLKGDWVGKTAWPLESTAINYPIQGTGGDQKYLALAVARNLLPQFGGYFYYELHDGLFFIFPEDKAIAASEVFLQELSNLPYEKAWGVKLPIQFPVDAKIGVSWGDLTDLEKFK